MIFCTLNCGEKVQNDSKTFKIQARATSKPEAHFKIQNYLLQEKLIFIHIPDVLFICVCVQNKQSGTKENEGCGCLFAVSLNQYS